MSLDVQSSWFEPLRPMLARLSLEPLPDAHALQAALGEFVAPVRFEPQEEKRRRRAPLVLDALYEVRIARHGRVPTRTHVHDVMNALVWATFPESKRVLAARQCRALVAQVGETPTRLPNARTRERDVLAMIDEGGVLVLDGGALVFGHAIHEHLATSAAPVRGFPIPLALPRDAPAGTLDAALARWIEALDPDAFRATAVVLHRGDPFAHAG